jgi:hypothetical protein
MDRSTFENAFKGILELFPSALGAARVARIAEITQNIEFEELRRLDKHLVDTSRYAPLPDDFKKAIRELNIQRTVSIKNTDVPHKAATLDIGFLGDDWFFDETKVFKRGKSVKDCVFILFSESPDHPLVIAAKAKIKECLSGRAKFIPTASNRHNEVEAKVFDFFYGKPGSSLFKQQNQEG